MPVIDGVNYVGTVLMRNSQGQMENVNPEFLKQKLAEGATIIDNYSSGDGNFKQTYDRNSGNISVTAGGSTPDVLRNQSYNTGNLTSNNNNSVTPGSYSPQSGSQGSNDILDRIAALNRAKQDSIVASLGKSRDNQLSSLAGEEATIKPMYYDKRNAAAASNQIGRRSLAEELARRGESTGGVADQATISANASLQNDTGLLRRQEAADLTDIARRRTDVNNAYEYDVANAKANLETANLQAVIDQLNADRSFNYQVGRDAVNDSRYNQEYADSRSDKTYDRNYQAQRDAVLDKRYNDQTTYAQEQDRINNLFRNEQFIWQKEQADLDREWQKGQFDYQKARDLVSDDRYKAEWKQKLDEWTFNKSKDQWMAQLQQNQFNYQKARDKVAQQNYDKEWLQKMDEWAWSKSEDNPQVKAQILDNQIKDLQLANLPEQQKLELQQLQQSIKNGELDYNTGWWELNNLKKGLNKDGSARKPVSSGSDKSVTSAQYQSFIEKTFFSKPQTGTDDNGNPVYGQVPVLKNKQALAQYIVSLIDSGVDESITDGLFAKYGISLSDLVNDRNR